MKSFITGLFDSQRHLFEGKDAKLGWAWPLFEGTETVLITPDHATQAGAHVRDPVDMKRMMIMVIYALIPCILMGMYNVGRQGFMAEGVDFTILDAMVRGAWHMLPIVITSYTFGGVAEVLFCVVRKHEINEGFLVTAMLFPLTLPPTIPLWMVAAGVVFGVVIGKEVFGGVGMNVLNPALTARAFVFFAYPGAMSGAKVWDVSTRWWPMATDSAAHISSYTGATPLLTASAAGVGPGVSESALLEAGWNIQTMAIGLIPGSIGEVSTIAAAIGAIFLMVMGLASYRIIIGSLLGLTFAGLALNGVAGPESSAIMHLPFYYHFVMGGFAFGAIFMATDPVSASGTNTGRWIYGFLVGMLCVLVRVVNPAYPEGMMLAILFMNVFAPLIDYFVVKSTTKRRAARLAQA